MKILKVVTILSVPVLVFSLFSCGQQGAAVEADIVLKNGAVYTMEESQPWAKATVIAGNTIIAVFALIDYVRTVIGIKRVMKHQTALQIV